ncbi:hypothetical protein GB937_001387 [Aspergillus fischeri]|nr:hypothetical protein GB937_001387 [Aspergillus fischeri]
MRGWSHLSNSISLHIPVRSYLQVKHPTWMQLAMVWPVDIPDDGRLYDSSTSMPPMASSRLSTKTYAIHHTQVKPKGGITYTRAKSYRALSDALKLQQCYGALGLLSALVFCRAKGV